MCEIGDAVWKHQMKVKGTRVGCEGDGLIHYTTRLSWMWGVDADTDIGELKRHIYLTLTLSLSLYIYIYIYIYYS